MRLPLLLGACGALLGGFGVAGLANGMWASPSAWEHSRAGFQIALGLPYGIADTPVIFSRSSGLTQTKAGVEGGPARQVIEPARASVALNSLEGHASASHSPKTANAGEPSWMLAHVSPAQPPEPPAPPAPPQSPSIIQSPHGVHTSMDPALAQEMARADRQVLQAARASLKAAYDASRSSMLVSTMEIEGKAVSGPDLRQLQREVSDARAMLRVAQTLANRVQGGDFSRFSVNYDGQTRCGSANLVQGCLPLKPSDMARIRAESAEQLIQARLDFRHAEDNLACAQRIELTNKSKQARLTDG